MPTGFSRVKVLGLRAMIRNKALPASRSAVVRSRTPVVFAREYSVHGGLAWT
jgi:hypothetical protein